jgi:heme/copper-type cytochrome/quinol oxidase subunit 2
METVESKKINDFSIKQFVWFLLGITSRVGGATMLVFGLIGDYGDFANNFFADANAHLIALFHFGMSMTWFGVFLILLGALIIALALNFAARSEEREKEREVRRQERLKAFGDASNNLAIDIEQTTVIENRDEKK